MRALLFVVLLLPLAGCGTMAPSLPEGEPGSAPERAAASAVKLIGAPYRYGGATPAGFDCSGLVQWSFREAGWQVPRSTEAQRLAAQLVERTDLRPGDLLFFDLERRKNSHVGIYTGGGHFVHAPSTGKEVRRDRLDAPFWRRAFSEARRLVL